MFLSGGVQVVDFQREKNRLETACALLLRLSWCVQPPVTSPQGFTSRAYYNNAHGRAWGISVQYPPCTFKVVKAV